MRELEQRIREASHRDRPEVPPANGFDTLHRRMSAPKEQRRRRALWPIVSLAGLLLAMVWWPYRTPAVHSSTEQPAATVQAVTPPVLPPVKEEVIKDKTSGVPAEVTGNAAREVYLPARSVPPTVTVAAPVEKPIEKLIERQDRNYAFASGPRRRISALPSNLPSYVRPTAPTLPFDTLALAINPTSLLPRADRLEDGRSGSWDISLSLYPARIEHGGYSTEWMDTPDPAPTFTGTPFIVDGEARGLYQANFHLLDYRTIDPIFQLKVNRQTRGILRYGVGATYFRGQDNQSRAVASLNRQGTENYFTVSKQSNDLLLASANIGVTLRRNSRLQPWINLSLQLGIGGKEKEENYLVRGDQRWLQTTKSTWANYLTGTEYPLLPGVEAGIQYRLGQHWSAGINLGGVPSRQVLLSITPGAEVRYHW